MLAAAPFRDVMSFFLNQRYIPTMTTKPIAITSRSLIPMAKRAVKPTFVEDLELEESVADCKEAGEGLTAVVSSERRETSPQPGRGEPQRPWFPSKAEAGNFDRRSVTCPDSWLLDTLKSLTFGSRNPSTPPENWLCSTLRETKEGSDTFRVPRSLLWERERRRSLGLFRVVR